MTWDIEPEKRNLDYMLDFILDESGPEDVYEKERGNQEEENKIEKDTGVFLDG